MKLTIPSTIIKLANTVAKVPGLKKLLKPFYYGYKETINRNRVKYFQLNGVEVLRLFDKVMLDNNIPYTVFAGTMLGAVREHGFIPHDTDIDVAIFYKDRPNNLTDLLCKFGFTIVRRFSVQNGNKGLEETYIKDNVTIDIFYIYREGDNLTYQCDFHSVRGTISWEDSMRKYGYVVARRLEFPVCHNFLRLPFSNIWVNIIENYDEWLRCRYGQDYMVPDPNFSDNNANPYIITDWLEASYEKF